MAALKNVNVTAWLIINIRHKQQQDKKILSHISRMCNFNHMLDENATDDLVNFFLLLLSVTWIVVLVEYAVYFTTEIKIYTARSFIAREIIRQAKLTMLLFNVAKKCSEKNHNLNRFYVCVFFLSFQSFSIYLNWFRKLICTNVPTNFLVTCKFFPSIFFFLFLSHFKSNENGKYDSNQNKPLEKSSQLFATRKWSTK